MKKSWLMVAVVVLGLSLVGLVFKTKILDRHSPAALQVTTIPSAVVFVDGTQIGVTGAAGLVNDKLESGEHSVRLVPESTENGLTSWEGKVNLSSGVRVAISRFLGPNDAESGGEVLTLEKINSRDQAFLAVVSLPDQAVVKINGEPRGFAPLVIEDQPPGSYEVVISSPGYQERQVTAQTIVGYKLVLDVQLPREIEGIQEASESAQIEAEVKAEMTKAETAEATEAVKPYVRVKDTPTGWLRVRQEASTDAAEVARVEPGQTFPYLDETKNGWHKIEYATDQEGWISGSYSDLAKD